MFVGSNALKTLHYWVGDMAQWLRALTALPKVLSSIPSNHMVAHNHLTTPDALFWCVKDSAAIYIK